MTTLQVFPSRQVMGGQWLLLGLLSDSGRVARPGTPQSGQYQLFDVAPGGVYTGQIEIANGTDWTLGVRVHQTDHAPPAGSGGQAVPVPRTLQKNAGWLNVPPAVVILPPRRATPVEFQIRVPAEDAAEPDRAYWSAIMVEPFVKECFLSIGRAPAVIDTTFRFVHPAAPSCGKTGS